MAEAGRIYPTYTHIETDEQGNHWLVLNHFESDSVIEELESSAKGVCIIDDFSSLSFDEDEYYGDDFI